MRPTSGKPQCEGKNKYSKNEAERTKALVGKARNKSVRIYQCPKCYAWHLTKSKGDNPSIWH